MRYKLFGIVLVLAGLGPAAHAQVFKCATADGQLTFSDKPCVAGSQGTLLERQKSWEEISRERATAAEAEERKYRARSAEREQQLQEQQMQLSRQQAAPSQRPSQSDSTPCREARKELDFVSSIRTLSQDEKRLRTNAAISNVNAACGSNTPLMQEPPKIVREAVHITHCDPGFCYDSRGRVWHKTGPGTLAGPDERTCTGSGTHWVCN